MYDINTKYLKKGINFHLPFLIGGVLGFVLLAMMTISNITTWNNLNSSILSSSVSVDSEKDDGFTMYTAVYHYTVDNNDYSCIASSKSTNIPSRKNKLVYYDSENPSTCMIKKTVFSNCIMLLYWIIPVLLILSSISSIKEINIRLKMINELNKKGKLVKKLPYRLEKTGMSSNNIPIQRIVVDYTLSNGENVALYGDARYDNKLCDADSMVDLLIDENNPDNYYIDFEINRLSGNLPQDYYNPQDFQ